MTAPGRPDLLALLGSRICHDLISPLGAIGNGLELLGMQAGRAGTELALISDSVADANARIRFFLIAFGAASAGQMTSPGDLADVLGTCFRTGRIALTHQLPEHIPRTDAKLMLLLVLCLETALPRGGEISLTGRNGAWRLRAEGAPLNPQPCLWDMLNAPTRAPEITAAEIQFALLPEAARQAGRALRVDFTDNAIELAC